MKYQKSFHL